MDRQKRATIASYDAHAGMFSEKFKELLEIHERFEFSFFMERLKGKRILDIGCGSGDHALFFMRKGFDVTGFDLSQGMVDIAKRNGVSAVVMDMEEMDFHAASFDGIWCVTSLLHIPKERCPVVVERMHRFLKPGGILYVCVKKGDGEGMLEKDGERFFAFWQPDELRALFGKFELLDHRETQLGSQVFLQMFFKK